MTIGGMVFITTGVIMALVAIQVWPIEVTPNTWGPLGLVPVSLVFIGTGLVLMFGRRWITVDALTGLVSRRQGLLVPMYTRQRHLSEFSEVVVAFERGDSESPDRYPVRLHGRNGGRDFVINSTAQYSEARPQAEYLCRFLDLPLVDTTTDHETVLRPEWASKSLRDRLMSGEPYTHFGAPPTMLSKVSESADRVTIVIPARESYGIWIIFALIIVVLIGIPTLRQLLSHQSQGSGPMVILTVVAVLAVAPLASVFVRRIVRKKTATTVHASPEGLSVDQRNTWGPQSRVMPAADILDVDCSTADGVLQTMMNSRPERMPVGSPAQKRLGAKLRRLIPNPGIVVKSRSGLITFGAGLPAGELQYLSSVLKKALAGR